MSEIVFMQNGVRNSHSRSNQGFSVMMASQTVGIKAILINPGGEGQRRGHYLKSFTELDHVIKQTGKEITLNSQRSSTFNVRLFQACCQELGAFSAGTILYGSVIRRLQTGCRSCQSYSPQR